MTKLSYYVDTDSFIIDVETDDFYKNISNDVEKWFHTSGYDKRLDRPLETGLNEKVLGKFKDEMDGNIITEFVTLCPKVNAINYEEYDFKNSNHKIKTSKRAKGTKICVIKKDLHFDDYMLALFSEKTIMRDQIRLKSDCHNIYTVKVNKVALRNRDNKRLQDYDKVTTYPIGTNSYIVCKSEMKIKLKLNTQAIPLYYFGDKTVNIDNIDNNPVNTDNQEVNIDNIDNSPVNTDNQEVNIDNIDNSPVNTDNQEVNIDNIDNSPVNTDNQEVNIDNIDNSL